VKSILVLGGGIYHVRLLDQLVSAGFRVLVCDRDPIAPGARRAHVFRPIDFSNSDEVLAFARDEKIDGIMPISDFGTRTASKVAKALGLPGLEPAKVDAVNDKGLMRDAWAVAGLAQPSYRVATEFEGLDAAARRIGYPCIVKPADSGGSGRGVSTVRAPAELAWAFDLARPFARNGRFIVETFVEGLEITVETITLPERGTVVLAMSDKVKPPLRTRVATSLNYPACLPPDLWAAAERLTVAAVEALGITVGMAHTEAIVTDRGPILLETGARGGGGHVFHTLIEATSGIAAPVVAARLLCGLPVELPPPRRDGAVYRFFNPPSGILRAVDGLENAANMPGVLDIGMIKKPGDRVGDLVNSLERTGYVVTKGATREEAIARADAVCRTVRFTVESSPA
jgi:biotin carboxylase